jgi:hypothetical protein
VHTCQLEVGELQRSLAAKEREAGGLRGSLAAAKRSYEQRLEHMEGQLAARDAEVRRWEGGCSGSTAGAFCGI